jgi:PAS domain-containing protein
MLVSREKKDPVASIENVRLRALDEYAVFDTPPDADLDRLVELAARMYGTPVAALSLVGRDRLFFKSRFGMQATGIGREGSFCSYAIENDGLFLVHDASKDERFASHPLVTHAPQIRFYAGIPLIAPSGQKIGTLCILDNRPWPEFTEDDRKNLEDVAALVMNRLELRRVEQATQGGHLRFERIASTSPDAIVGADASGLINYWNRAAENLFGYSASEATGQPVGLIFPERVRKLQTAEVMSLVNCGIRPDGAATGACFSTPQRRFFRLSSRSGMRIARSASAPFFAISPIASREHAYSASHIQPMTGLPDPHLINRLGGGRDEAGTYCYRPRRLQVNNCWRSAGIFLAGLRTTFAPVGSGATVARLGVTSSPSCYRH